MGAGNLVLAFSTPENVEVLAGTGLLFSDEAELAALLNQIVANPSSPDLKALRERAGDRIRLNYSWDRVTDQYEQLFERMISG